MKKNLRTDPARQVGNLAAPIKKEAPWPDSSPVQYSALDTLKDKDVVGLQTSTVGGLVNLGNLAAQGGISTLKVSGLVGSWRLLDFRRSVRRFANSPTFYGDVASRETGAYREALHSVASERKSEGQSELALETSLGVKDSKTSYHGTKQSNSQSLSVTTRSWLPEDMATESLGGLAIGGPPCKGCKHSPWFQVGGSNVAARLAGGGILAGQELAGIQSDVYYAHGLQETGSAEQASWLHPLRLLIHWCCWLPVLTCSRVLKLLADYRSTESSPQGDTPNAYKCNGATGKSGVTEAGGEFLQEGAPGSSCRESCNGSS